MHLWMVCKEIIIVIVKDHKTATSRSIWESTVLKFHLQYITIEFSIILWQNYKNLFFLWWMTMMEESDNAAVVTAILSTDVP
jgi:hypothetical protein